MRVPLFLLALLAVPGCAAPEVAPLNAGLSSAPDAPGYVVVGLAEQNYRWGVVTSTRDVALRLTSPGRDAVVAVRPGCGSVSGFIGTRPCDLSAPDAVVLRLPAGAWTVAGAVLDYSSTGGEQQLQGRVPAATFQVSPGQVLDLGTYIFASDADTKQMRLVQHVQTDALTRQTLARYSNLRAAPVSYAGGPAVP